VISGIKANIGHQRHYSQ